MCLGHASTQGVSDVVAIMEKRRGGRSNEQVNNAARYLHEAGGWVGKKGEVGSQAAKGYIRWMQVGENLGQEGEIHGQRGL